MRNRCHLQKSLPDGIFCDIGNSEEFPISQKALWQDVHVNAKELFTKGTAILYTESRNRHLVGRMPATRSNRTIEIDRIEMDYRKSVL